jgi:hypothetical protein
LWDALHVPVPTLQLLQARHDMHTGCTEQAQLVPHAKGHPTARLHGPATALLVHWSSSGSSKQFASGNAYMRASYWGGVSKHIGWRPLDLLHRCQTILHAPHHQPHVLAACAYPLLSHACTQHCRKDGCGTLALYSTSKVAGTPVLQPGLVQHTWCQTQTVAPAAVVCPCRTSLLCWS